uniref:Uncharacterized protein n=1 Tax=Tanacetum cinerariifolium TaxID=118510 RepID=A0A699KIJ9_TANCI|nr:hypothetical protein [Tanacetum cinerariifolium]
MPLALKTQNDSFAFVHELKQEMHADLEYVESLEKEIDKLESDKAEFSNMYDTLLQECVSNDVMCSYLHSLSDLDAHTGVQCLYLHKVKEYLKPQLQDKNIAISELKKLIEKMKGKSVDTMFKKPSILEKPPLQPIRNQLVVRQPTTYKSERSQLPRYRFTSQVGVSHNLTKTVTLHSWPHVKKSSFAKPYDVNAPGPSRKIHKHVSFQTPGESVSSNDMVHNYYLEEAKKKAQLHKDKALNTKPSVQQSARLPTAANEEAKKKAQLQKDKALNTKPSVQQYARLPNTANGNKSKPRNFNQQPRNWTPSMSSHVSNKTDNTTKPPRNQKSFLKIKDLECPTCKQCIFSANHDECILQYITELNSHASMLASKY